MARLTPLTYPVQHDAPARLERASKVFGRFTALGALLFALAAIGSLVFRAGGRLRRGWTAWSESRRQCEEDRRLWELALTDSRVMADLVALNQDMPHHRSAYF